MTLHYVTRFVSLAALVVTLCNAQPAAAALDNDPEDAKPAPAEESSAPAAAQDASDDAALKPAEPEYRVINIPTTLVIPRNRLAFDLTHRFAGNLANNSFADSAKNLFGLDQGALIGFEFRYGIVRHVQAAVYRTTIDKTFQFHGKYDAIQQGKFPLSVSAVLSVEGADNFTEDYAPALGASISHTIKDAVALYATPIWVHNTAPRTGETRDTGILGLAARVRIRPTVYLVGEVTPRLGGYQPGDPEYGFGIEKRAGGHLFQLNFTNTFSTTYAQMARGGFPDSLYLGFNLARKFF